MSAVEDRQRNFERYALGYRQPVECVPDWSVGVMCSIIIIMFVYYEADKTQLIQ